MNPMSLLLSSSEEMGFLFLSHTVMKNKFIIFIVGISVLLVAASCQHHYPASLVEADSLVYSNPEVALQSWILSPCTLIRR